MSGKKTLIWAVILAALGAFYYFYEIQGGEKREEAAKQRGLLVHMATDEVTGITITRQDETIRMVQRDDAWRLTEPLAVPGDGQKCGELIRYVAELRHTRVVDEQPSDLAPFGLDTPSLVIEMTRSAALPAVTLRLGAANPTGSSYYAQVAGNPAVYLVPSMAKDVLDASLDDLRDKTLLAFATADVQQVQITYSTEEPVTLQRQEGDTWQITTPVQARADKEQVQGLLQRLHTTKVQSFVTEEAADLAPYGLQEPAVQLALQLGPAQTVPALLLGRVDTAAKGVYAKRRGAAGVFLLPDSFWEELPKTVRAWRDKTLLQYEREHVARLELQSAAGAVRIVQTGPRAYKLEEPEEAPGDSDAVYRFLADLQELKAKDIVTDDPTAPDAYGFADPRQKVTLRVSPPDAEETTHTLVFGADAPEGEGTYVKTGEQPTVYLVDQQAAQRLIETTALSLRDKKILAFESEAIHKIQIHYPDTQFTLERQNDTWKLTEPSEQDVTQHWRVDNVLYELNALAYTNRVADRVEDAARYGLDAPQVQVTLWQEDGSTIGPLVIGKAEEIDGAQALYVQVGADSPLYTIAPELLDNLPKTPAAFTTGS